MKETSQFKEGLVITANYQTRGSGQREKSWESLTNENLLISVVVESNILIKNQFLLSKCVDENLKNCDVSYGNFAKSS